MEYPHMTVDAAIENIIKIADASGLSLEFTEDGELTVFSADWHLAPPTERGGDGTRLRGENEKYV